MTHPMADRLRRIVESAHPEWTSAESVLAAADELDRLHAIVEKMPKCAACNRPCIPEGGMAICSDECYERVAEWGADVKKSMDEYAKEADDAN